MIYRNANAYFREKFGCRMYKAAVSISTSCPNRDGSKGTGGCAFCSALGSGDYASPVTLPVRDQIDRAIAMLSRKTGDDTRYIAYFQSFTSTYCDPGMLERALDEAASHPLVRAVSVGTRPDCLGGPVPEILRKTAEKMPLFVELGLQTSDEDTARSFNRCYGNDEYVRAVSDLHGIGAEVITHVIFGLPGEDRETMIRSVRFACDHGTDGIKFTCLYILEGTPYAQAYREGKIKTLTMDGYFDIVEEALSVLPDNVTVHRLTGDPPKRHLIAPLWTADKRSVVNYINRRFSG